MGRRRRTATGGLLLPLLLLTFAVAVAYDVPGAGRLLQLSVDAYFSAWSWLGEQVADRVTDATRRA